MTVNKYIISIPIYDSKQIHSMYKIDTHLYGCTMYVYFCSTDNIVDGYIFSTDIILFPLCTAEGS